MSPCLATNSGTTGSEEADSPPSKNCLDAGPSGAAYHQMSVLGQNLPHPLKATGTPDPRHSPTTPWGYSAHIKLTSTHPSLTNQGTAEPLDGSPYSPPPNQHLGHIQLHQNKQTKTKLDIHDQSWVLTTFRRRRNQLSTLLLETPWDTDPEPRSHPHQRACLIYLTLAEHMPTAHMIPKMHDCSRLPTRKLFGPE